MQSRLDDAVEQLRELAGFTEEQAKTIEWLKTHRPDETEGRPALLDDSESSQHDDSESNSAPASAEDVGAVSDSPKADEKSEGDENPDEKPGSDEKSKPEVKPTPPDVQTCLSPGEAARRFKGRKYVPDTQERSNPASPKQLAQRKNQEAA